MKTINLRKIALILALLLTLGIVAGCGSEKKSEDETYSSESLGLFRYEDKGGSKYVVDAYGKRNDDYKLDDDGNICKDGKPLITSAKVKEYKYVSTIISLNDTTTATVNLTKQIKAGTISEYEDVPVLYEYKVYISPANANHPEVAVRSSNSNIAEVLTSGGATTSTDGSTVLNPIEGVATAYIQCKMPGSAMITISAIDESNVSLTFTIDVKESSYMPEEAALASTTEEIIPTTENTQGWITGTNVRFRQKPELDADIIAFYNTGKEVAILGTSNDGWVKCQIDNKVGYVKSDFVTRIYPSNTTTTNNNGVYIVRTPSPTATATPVPTATAAIAPNDGLDHGYATGAQTEQIINQQEEAGHNPSHVHYYVKYAVIDPTPTSEGYTVYRCECGASYKTNYKPAG